MYISVCIATKVINNKLTIAQLDQCNVSKTYSESSERNRLPWHQEKTLHLLLTLKKWKGRKQRVNRREVKQSTCLEKTVRKRETTEGKRKKCQENMKECKIILT